MILTQKIFNAALKRLCQADLLQALCVWGIIAGMCVLLAHTMAAG